MKKKNKEDSEKEYVYFCPTCDYMIKKFEDIEFHTYKGGEPYPVHSKCQKIIQRMVKNFRKPIDINFNKADPKHYENEGVVKIDIDKLPRFKKILKLKPKITMENFF